MLFTVLTAALVTVLLFGCASNPASTREDLTPAVITPANTDASTSGGTVEPTPTLGEAESDPVVTPPAASTPTETTPDSPSSVVTPTLMEFMAADTRHFIGDPDAPVTIIEFGDFQ